MLSIHFCLNKDEKKDDKKCLWQGNSRGIMEVSNIFIEWATRFGGDVFGRIGLVLGLLYCH